jgi:hypothetical protein
MNRTGAYWTHLAGQARHLAGLLLASGLNAVFVKKTVRRLRIAQRKAEKYATREIGRGNISAKAGVVIFGGEAVPQTSKRAPRQTPANSFKGRLSTVTWGKKKQQFQTIAEAVCWIFDQHGSWEKKGFVATKEVDQDLMAQAIKKAWPESTYGPHRVVYDYKKFLAKAFTCQRQGLES